MKRIALFAAASCSACFSDPGGVGASPTTTDGTGPASEGGSTLAGSSSGAITVGSEDSQSETSEGSSSTGIDCDPADGPGDGIFVSSTSGDDLSGQGTPVLPFATIAAGIEAAVAAGADTIYLDEGTYAERVVVPDTTTGLRIEGGFVATGASWLRDCEPGVVGRTVIAAPANDGAAVQVFGVTHASRLVRLTVATASQDSTPPDIFGDTRIGVHVVDGVFALELVDVLAGRAGDGGAASPGMAGATAPAPGEDPACVGSGDCQDGSDGGNGAGAGASAEPGTFNAMGFKPSDGAPGVDGEIGNRGTSSPVGPQSSTNCHENCGCSNNSCTDTGAVLTLYGGVGRCGCGGEGGLGGTSGRGGGASVALLVAGERTPVSVDGGSLRGGDAGNGSPGGDGGDGGSGSPGVEGGMQSCHAGCGTGGGPCALCASISDHPLLGGQAGGSGGNGGHGSRGGGGAGGDAFAIVRVGGAVVVIAEETEIVHGSAGAGAQGAADGREGVEFVVD